MSMAERDPHVEAKLDEMKLQPKDRKISNVVLENMEQKKLVEDLKLQNEKLRDQLESAQTGGMGGEELSIF